MLFDKLKNKPLAVQIWLVFACITLSISILLALFILLTLRHFFTSEIFATIEDVQHALSADFVQEDLSEENIQEQHYQRLVNHLIFLQNGRVMYTSGQAYQLPQDVIQALREEAQQQQEPIQRYTKKVGEERILYVIRQGVIGTRSVSLVSYMFDTYRNDMVFTLFKRIVVIMLLVLLLSWFPSIMLARYLTNPLVQMEKHVERMTNKHWHTPLLLDRKDEIGKLARSIDQMRDQLLKQDEAQQSLLQNISHELKTPVMVIRSYAQALQDGIYPQGDLKNTVHVIESESARLQKLIQNLLYLTKLDYLSSQKPDFQPIDLGQLLESVIDRLKWQRPELEWHTSLPSYSTQGDPEQLTVAFENLLDNQIRYAEKRIEVEIRPYPHPTQRKVFIRFYNDGESIDQHKLDQLFKAFHKGEKGKYGLGLTIVARIANIHQAEVWAQNEGDGVAFYLMLSNEA